MSSTVPKYTHLLDIRLVDSDKNILENPVLLNVIKQHILLFPIIQTIELRGKNQDCEITWRRMSWSHPYSNFLPDLCTIAEYDFDYIVEEHTKKTLHLAENEIKRIAPKYGMRWSIIFYLSKPLTNKTSSIGFI
jgi:hypothetical protein